MQIPKISNSREILPILRSISLFCLALLVITATTVIAWLMFSFFITTPTQGEVMALYDLRRGAKPESVENATFIFVLIFSSISIGLAASAVKSTCGQRADILMRFVAARLAWGTPAFAVFG